MRHLAVADFPYRGSLPTSASDRLACSLNVAFPPDIRLLPAMPAPARSGTARGPGWFHEVKHDGFGLMARRDGRGVRLYTRNGYDFADRFPQVVEAILSLPAPSCFIDGEVIVVDKGQAVR